MFINYNDLIPIGYKAILNKLNLETLPHYRESYIAKQGRGKAIFENHLEIHIFPKSYAIQHEADCLEQLEFALKYDGVNLEIIKAIFDKIEKSKIETYIKKQPTGIYARKIWYLYEFLMNDRLNLADCQRIKYVDLLDTKKYFTSSPIKSSRHGINDNLLGNNKFCPIVRRTENIKKFIELKLDEKAKAILEEYDPYLVSRASNYLYTKETMSSYQIEKERPDKSRIARFVGMLQHASKINVLTKEKLIELQNIIVDPRFRDIDYRRTQNYVGENINPVVQRIHYISPKSEDVPELMQGLLDALNRMLFSNVHPVIIAATISFGFVFIHPFEDGNGRIHRFLIHYVLSKKEFTPKNMIFPVSYIMLQNMFDYNSILEAFSEPLLLVLKNYDLSDEGYLTVKQNSKIYYQYIDYTLMTEYLFECIDEALKYHVVHEIEFLVKYDKAKKVLQDIVDMPDNKMDLFIKFVLQNNGKISKPKKERFFSILSDDEISQLESVIFNYMIKKEME